MIGKIPWRRAWQPIPVFLPGKSHGQRSLAGYSSWGFPGGSVVKNPLVNTGDMGLIPGSGRSPGEGNGNPFQYFCWDNPMDRGASQATVHGVTKNQTRFSDSTAASLRTLFLCIVSPRGCKKSDTTERRMLFTLSLFHKFIVLCSNV